ncbi:Serine/threonine-protein kinase PrkC [Rosistilla carotiformis]|uniref:Serine/threonine-protein kinase PrkC n=1 Tax=Rosistilla carotiformis TaxID=2528017 RepID=A0A518JW86_9BACT|nr:serine/threonine-protein kinase [Rosistilla carotiformis]QDV69808.1 Serine/threonine-protein kinase PrkC [Rosistilla carotiformis]
MTDSPTARAQELFLAALELPDTEREPWLRRECATDPPLFRNVMSLLGHAEPTFDRLEQNLDDVIADLPRAEDNQPSSPQHEPDAPSTVSRDDFLSKLAEVGVLTSDELESISHSTSVDDPGTDPRTLASKLVTEGKLTDYQASALLKGEPDLLIDKYLILDLIDVGGMGMVFKAIHRTMNRVVAVKMISPQMLGSASQVKRFQREVRVAATLEHPNIVRAYDADKSRGVHFLVMEYVRGDNLNKLVRDSGPLSLSLAVDYIRQAAVGLQHAHERGIVHRDIKPGNLLVSSQGTIKVLDLGLAHIDDSLRHKDAEPEDESGRTQVSQAELTTAGAILGTASFMAPEQSLDAHLVDFRSDVYSLGCTLYFLLTGDTPYSGSTVFKVFVEHREGEIPSLQEERPDVPDSVESVFRKMVAKKPDHRFQSMSELIVALEDCRIARPESQSPASLPDAAAPAETDAGKVATSGQSVRSPVTKQRMPLIFGAIFAVVLIALAAIYLPEWKSSHTYAPSGVTTEPGITSSTSEALADADTIATNHNHFVQAHGSAADRITAGNWDWELDKNLGPIVNSPQMEFGADMSADGLTLVVSSSRGVDSTDRDLFMLTRQSANAEWSEPVGLPPEINTKAGETSPQLSDDGLTLSFMRGAKRFTARRESKNQPWSPPVEGADEAGLPPNIVSLTRDRLTAFSMRKKVLSETESRYVLQTWRRSSQKEPFGPSTISSFDASGVPMKGATLSKDGRMFVSATQINPGETPIRTALFWATRDDWTAPWSAPVRMNLPEMSGIGTPRLLSNATSLLFVAQHADGGHGRADIWMASLVKKGDAEGDTPRDRAK